MSHLILNLQNQPLELVRENLHAAAATGRAMPEIEVSIHMDGATLAELFEGRPVQQTAPPPSLETQTQPTAGAEVTPAAPTDDLGPVKRRSKEEIAAGLTSEQAAQFRASGADSVDDWVSETGITPGDIPEEEETPDQATDDDPGQEDNSGSDIPDIPYQTLSELAIRLHKTNDVLKKAVVRLAKEVFDVNTFGKIENPRDWGKAYLLLQDIEETGDFPDAGRVKDVMDA